MLDKKLLFRAELALTTVVIEGYANMKKLVEPFPNLKELMHRQINYPFHLNFPRPDDINRLCQNLEQYVVATGNDITEDELVVIIALWLKLGRVVVEYGLDMDKIDGLEILYQGLFNTPTLK